MSIIKDNGLFNKLSQTIAKASENIKNKKNIEAGINEKINNRNKLKSTLDCRFLYFSLFSQIIQKPL